MQQFMNFNPYMTPQQRIAQMEQQYNMNFAQQPVQTVQQQGYKLVTIGSIEEAKAAPVDTINDTPSFFFNRGKNEIYLKQYNSQNGLPIFCTFQLVQEPTNEVNKKTEPNIYENNFKALNDKIDSFNSKIDGLYSLISTIQVEPKSEQVSDQVSEKTDQVKKGGKNAK